MHTAVQELTSRKNPLVLQVSSLNDKKHRDELGAFLVSGIKLTTDALNAGLSPKTLFITARASEKYADLASNAAFLTDNTYLVTEEIIAKITSEDAPQGIVAVFEKPKTRASYGNNDSVLLFDGVQNPLNIGAVIRSAEAFGFSHIVLSADCADIYAPKVLRSAMGSIFRVNITYTAGMKQAVCDLRENHRVFGTALNQNSATLGKTAFLPNDCIVIGNEGHGVSADILDACTSTLFIPMTGKTESLNAAVSASVVMWEMKRSILTGGTV